LAENLPLLLSAAGGGFAVAFFHAAIPTHWLPFVLTARVQGWSRPRTLLVTAIAGGGHVLFTALLGILIIALGLEVSRWTGQVFPWIAAGVLFAFGLFFLIRQARGQGHAHLFGKHGHHDHGHHGHGDGPDHDHHDHDHHDGHQHDHGHSHDHEHPHRKAAIPGVTESRTFVVPARPMSDRSAIFGLLMLLTFSPCEGFLPVYVSAIQYGWTGFAVLSLVLAAATLAGMVLFTSLTLAGLDRLNLRLLEHYESAILGGVLCLLGIVIVLVET
jgi:ABC-type nickel/cobalt efflux system permease component RcnA